jgi:hypothetical protein
MMMNNQKKYAIIILTVAASSIITVATVAAYGWRVYVPLIGNAVLWLVIGIYFTPPPNEGSKEYYVNVSSGVTTSEGEFQTTYTLGSATNEEEE